MDRNGPGRVLAPRWCYLDVSVPRPVWQARPPRTTSIRHDRPSPAAERRLRNVASGLTGCCAHDQRKMRVCLIQVRFWTLPGRGPTRDRRGGAVPSQCVQNPLGSASMSDAADSKYAATNPRCVQRLDQHRHRISVSQTPPLSRHCRGVEWRRGPKPTSRDRTSIVTGFTAGTLAMTGGNSAVVATGGLFLTAAGTVLVLASLRRPAAAPSAGSRAGGSSTPGDSRSRRSGSPGWLASRRWPTTDTKRSAGDSPVLLPVARYRAGPGRLFRAY